MLAFGLVEQHNLYRIFPKPLFPETSTDVFTDEMVDGWYIFVFNKDKVREIDKTRWAIEKG